MSGGRSAAIRAPERLPRMPKLQHAALAGLILALPLAACGKSEPKPDAAVIDQHLNRLIAQEEAEQRRLVEEARAREDVREAEMKQREDGYENGSAGPSNEAAAEPEGNAAARQ